MISCDKGQITIEGRKDRIMAELTSLVHGREEADRAQETARGIFSGNLDTENMPEASLADSDFVEGRADIMQLLVAAGLAGTRSDARRLVQQGGVSVNDEKITDIRQSYTKEELSKGMVLKKGKKAFRRIVYN